MTNVRNAFDLERFVRAQAANYDEALAEIRAGEKRSHWSWYVFPQIKGLGSSTMSVRYSISGLDEARAYLKHPVLTVRLRDCVAAMNSHSSRTAVDVLGDIDGQKFHSCVTLFAQVAEADSSFHKALAKYFKGQPDSTTLSILGRLAQRV